MTYALNQCFLFKCHSKKELAKKLNTSVKDLKHLSHNPSYNHFYKSKKNKIEKRLIQYATSDLMMIQKNIHYYLSNVYKPDFLTGGIKGKSPITNSKIHQNNSFWLKFDISDFYDNCKFKYIYNFFLEKMKCSKDISYILSKLTTFDGQLIQGSPSSLDLSYFAYSEMFSELDILAKENNLSFSTYVDDFTFSGSTNSNFSNVKLRVKKILNRYGHKLKYNKVKSYSKGNAKNITGIVVNKNQQIRVPNSRKKEIIDSCSQLFQNPPLRYDKHFVYSNLGKLINCRQIQPDIFDNYYHFLLHCKKHINIK